MRRRRKILGGIVIALVAVVAGIALAVSYNSPCAVAEQPAGTAPLMKAAVARCYGPPDVVRIEELPRPVLANGDDILIKVHAASINPLDWRRLRGSPYLMRLDSGLGTPVLTRFGADFAGTVEAVGSNVTKFRPGDEVFGGTGGGLAQYLIKREHESLAIKPAQVTFEQASTANVAGITALQALRDHGRVRPGTKVLINGASGGVGTFAIQIAKSFGAEVTGVCSTRNVDLVRSLGADHVIDYTHADFTSGGQRYDVIIDNVANRSMADLRRVLEPEGRLVIVGGRHGNWIAPFALPLKAFVMTPFVDQTMGMMMAKSTQDDMKILADLMATGKLTPVIERTYPLSESAEAIRYVETGRARGKVVVIIPQDSVPLVSAGLQLGPR